MAGEKVGLTSVAGYVPRYRLSGKGVAQVWGGGGSGERAVANYDEDALTTACEAALSALSGRDTSRIGACFFASTSAPYIEKSNATMLATVADLPVRVLTADLSGSLRAGTTALRLALDSVHGRGRRPRRWWWPPTCGRWNPAASLSCWSAMEPGPPRSAPMACSPPSSTPSP